MKAKDKAEELMKQFDFVYIQNYTSNFEVKQCALICVEEIIQAIDWHDFETPNKELIFWEEVKEELNKMK
jgi:hypothetical protein